MGQGNGGKLSSAAAPSRGGGFTDAELAKIASMLNDALADHPDRAQGARLIALMSRRIATGTAQYESDAWRSGDRDNLVEASDEAADLLAYLSFALCREEGDPDELAAAARHALLSARHIERARR